MSERAITRLMNFYFVLRTFETEEVDVGRQLTVDEPAFNYKTYENGKWLKQQRKLKCEINYATVEDNYYVKRQWH